LLGRAITDSEVGNLRNIGGRLPEEIQRGGDGFSQLGGIAGGGGDRGSRDFGELPHAERGRGENAGDGEDAVAEALETANGVAGG
jgi:hypothetical protein